MNFIINFHNISIYQKHFIQSIDFLSIINCFAMSISKIPFIIAKIVKSYINLYINIIQYWKSIYPYNRVDT
jgi:hypothetical protein